MVFAILRGPYFQKVYSVLVSHCRCDMKSARQKHRFVVPLLAAALSLLAGCGTSKSRSATEQLLISDAVDRTVSRVDFRVLSGQTVYFDTTYIKSVKGVGFVNADYVISALRQQMVAAGCLLEEQKEDADFVVEGRLGALGTDDSEVVYGMPASTAVASAASLLPSVPAVPAIPEISIARKQDYQSAAKIGLFAYHRVTRQPVWQSGVSLARSTAKDTWIMGAGPFQTGSIYKRARFAGDPIRIPLIDSLNQPTATPPEAGVPYDEAYTFNNLQQIQDAAAKRRAALMVRIESLDDSPDLLGLSESALGAPRRINVEERVAERPSALETKSPTKKPSADSPPATSSDASPPPAAESSAADASATNAPPASKRNDAAAARDAAPKAAAPNPASE